MQAQKRNSFKGELHNPVSDLYGRMHFERNRISHLDFVEGYPDMKFSDVKFLAPGHFRRYGPSNLHIMPNKGIFPIGGYKSDTVGFLSLQIP